MPKHPKRTAAELAMERALARGVIESMTNAMGHPPVPRRSRTASTVMAWVGWLVVAVFIVGALAVACR